MNCYVGVEFQNNGGISLVHSAWLTPLKREVFWPPKQTTGNFIKLLKSGQEPPQDNSWKLHQIKRIFFQTDDYKIAEKKIKKAEITSDLTTDAEESAIISPRRKIRPKKFSTDDEQEEVLSSSEDDFPKNKKPLPRPKPIIRKSITNILSDYSGPIQTFPLASAGQSQRSFEDSDSTNQLYYLPPQHSAKDTQLTKSSGQIIRGSASNQSFCQAAVSNSSPYNPSTSKATDVQSNIRAVVESNGANTQDDVITLLKTIREQNNQILQWIRKQDRSGNHASNTDLPDDIGVQFPLNSQEDITKLETYLSEKNNCLALSAYLSTFGGRDFTGHTNRILNFLFTYSLATNWNFCGKRGEKKAFKNLNVKDVIIGAVRKSSPLVSQKEIEDTIKVWLKHAPEKLKKQQHGNP
ncbi:uncharacterized protein LOC130901655 [Diorhabda carinulata]|uniref:uncharacterized protein LOC130444708 n=1 Tax=Diorhabda sublineata TaxID=1163346 RepID=UPI0024E10E6C|nr:uncharacterized protein LOC130444708 [Diorhabda sublineata]XP_057652896.1 uncharacterized protein LOC130891861 [Diorhabda carinulata]XP_057661946.1 uncharacterized protein LOC130897216 [Diorhabda carinulata]XP_057669160.1 uncharacterized protein LOC130901655 [Diorhabda carinulata]